MTREIPNPITKEFLEAEAQSVNFTHITGTLTHCAITVEGGFIFTGESACADPANYDEVKGQQYAHENAISKMWLPYGFLLKHQLMEKERDVNRAPQTSKERHILATPSDIQLSAGNDELTVEQIEALANGKALCDCCEFVSSEDCPVKAGDSFDFGTAVYLLENGYRVARAGWNGKGMYVYYVPAASYPVERNNLATMGGKFPNDMVPYREYLALKTAQNDVATWTPSCSDALAKDWELYQELPVKTYEENATCSECKRSYLS